ncbi:MAG: PQQ-like beta-propeller repeat protein [candidate division KSB1 bacterium]|nr:PQQ-like beta-propeller repeat protein [candidate division KSB1 bacterium]
MLRFLILLLVILFSIELYPQGWRQLQNNSEHHGRVSFTVSPPYRVRWFWVGENLTLRNRRSVPGWPHDLDSRPGYSFPLPASVDFTISGNVQVVSDDSLVYFGTMDGDFFFVRRFDGATRKKIRLDNPVVSTAAVEGSVVVVAGLYGSVYGLSTPTGGILWRVDFPKAITIAPIIRSGRVYCADHSGRVSAIDLQSGAVLWSQNLRYPVQGTPAANDNYLVVCSEDMNVHLLNAQTGALLRSRRVYGQSFRDTHVVILDNMAYVTAVPAPMFGSEWMMEEVMEASTSFDDEEQKILAWLTGNSPYPYASPDWKTKYAFRLPSFDEAFPIASGPNDGCGMSPPSMVVDNQNRVLSWFKTRFPTFTDGPSSIFGSNYNMDIMYIHPQTGRRMRIELGRDGGMWMRESDNLYALSVSGNLLWMRQNFRGTQVIDLTTADYSYVQVEAQVRDGGDFTGANFWYVYNEINLPETSQPHWQGRVAPSFAGGFAFWCENYGVVCVETDLR